MEELILTEFQFCDLLLIHQLLLGHVIAQSSDAVQVQQETFFGDKAISST